MTAVIRRNTDYGLRMMETLAVRSRDGELISASELVSEGNVSYEVGRKLLQELREAKLVRAVRGSKGGFKLNREPSEISLKTIIDVLQGGIFLNMCMERGKRCDYKSKCRICPELICLQKVLDDYMGKFTLDRIIRSTRGEKATRRRFKKKEQI